MTALPAAISTGLLTLFLPVALALVVYFRWRGGLKSRIIAHEAGDDEPARAA